MLYYQGYHGGATSLHIAKDIAENNRGARVLVVTAEDITHGFGGLSDPMMISFPKFYSAMALLH